MNYFLKIVEKILTNIVLTFVLFFFSFSFMTGQFPPRKDDFRKVFTLGKEIFMSSHEYNQTMKTVDPQNPSLEQMVQIQRLGLRRSEAALQLTQVMVRFKNQPPAPVVAEKLLKVSDEMNRLDEAMNSLNTTLTQLAEGK